MLWVILFIVGYIVVGSIAAIAVGKSIAHGMGNTPNSVQYVDVTYVTLDELLKEPEQSSDCRVRD